MTHRLHALPRPTRLRPLLGALLLALAAPAVHAQSATWFLDRINAPAAHRLGYSGAGVLVAVSDSGLDRNHPLFAGRIDPRSANFLGGDPNAWDDQDGHGSHVAGLALGGRGVGPMYGVAYDARLLVLRTIGAREDDNDDDDDDDDEPGGSATAQALRAAARAGAQVMNGSYGPPAIPEYALPHPTLPDVYVINPNYVRLPHQIMLYDPQNQQSFDTQDAQAMRAAAAADVLMVFAAGNEYEDQPLASRNPSGAGLFPYIKPANHASGVYRFIEGRPGLDLNNPATYTYLAANDARLAATDYSDLQGSLLVVVATNNQDRIASYSNRCGVTWQWCLAAPGGDVDANNEFVPSDAILSALPGGGYKAERGTSMASPLVAGAAALVRGVHPYLDARQVIEILLTTTRTDGHLSDRDIYGRGMLDVAKAAGGPAQFGAAGFAQVFDVDTRGQQGLWTNDISGTGGLTKRGAGGLTLTGTSRYTGATRVLDGTLTVNGSIATSTLMVGSGATLSGTGQVGPTTVAGTLAPGNSIGTLTVAGDYTHLAGATYAAEIDSQGRSDQLAVGGTARLQGGTLQLIGLDAGTLGRQYTLIDATGGIVGDFAAIAPQYLFFGLDGAASGSTYRLSVGRNAGGFAVVATSANQRAVAGGIDSLAPASLLYSNLLTTTDAATARRSLDALSGEIHPGVLGGLYNQTALSRNALLERGRVNLGAASLGAAGIDAASTGATSGRDTVWGQYLGNWRRTDAGRGTASLDASFHGALFGADRAVSARTRLGLSAGFGRSRFDADARRSRADADNYLIAAYGNSQWGSTQWRYGAAHAWHDVDSRRQIDFAQAGPARARYDARSAQVFGEVGLPRRVGALALEPFVGLAYAQTRSDGYTESGSAGLQADKARYGAASSTLGLRAGTDWQRATGTLSLQAMAGWRHGFGDRQPHTDMRLPGSTGFAIQGAPVGRDSLLLQAGLNWRGNGNGEVALGYGGELGSRNTDHALSARVAWRF